MAPPKRPWFRFYTEALTDPKLRRLTPAQRWLWVAVLGAARQSPTPGVLMLTESEPLTCGDLADLAGMPEKATREGLGRLEELGLVAVDDDGAWSVPKWNDRQFESDDTTARTRKHRQGNNETPLMERSNAVDGTHQRQRQKTDTDLLVSSTSDSTPEPVDDDEPERRSDGEKIRDAFELIVERRIGDKTPDDPRAYAATVRAAVRTEHAKAANEALSVHPDWNAHDLCEYLEPLKVKPAVAPEDVEERRRAEWRAGDAERTAARLAAEAEREGVLDAEAGVEQVRAIKQGLRKSKAA